MNDPRGASGYWVDVDQDLCVGTGDCAIIAPTGFALDPGDGRSRALSTAPVGPADDLLEAANNCPMQAIRVFDNDGNALN